MTIVDSLVPVMHHDPDRYWITDPDSDTPKEHILSLVRSLRLIHLSSASPRGGWGRDPGLMWENTGTLWELCNKFLPLWWGNCGDFASVQLRGDWERSIVCSIDGNVAEEKKKVCFFNRDKLRTANKLLMIEKVDFF